MVAVLLLLIVAFWALIFFTSESETLEESFDVGDIERIVIEGEAGDIELDVVDRDDIALSSELNSNVLAEAESSIDVEGNTLTVTSGCDPLFFALNCSVNHSIEVPVDAVEELELTTTAGDVDVSSFSGNVTLRATAGGIRLIEFSGVSADLETTAGSITVRATEAPELLSAQTTAGEVEIVVPDEIYSVSTDTTAGDADVLVRQDPESELVIEASTTAGDIRIANPDD